MRIREPEGELYKENEGLLSLVLVQVGCGPDRYMINNQNATYSECFTDGCNMLSACSHASNWKTGLLKQCRRVLSLRLELWVAVMTRPTSQSD